MVVELKATPFKPDYAGQLNFYINVVDDQLRGETVSYTHLKHPLFTSKRTKIASAHSCDSGNSDFGPKSGITPRAASAAKQRCV